MKTTTAWAFRRKYINIYSGADFKNFDDYFFYLHLNPHVLWAHVWGSCTGVLMFPWAIYCLIHDRQIWPFLLASVIFYAVGLFSHFTGDGVISATGKSFFKSYRCVILLIVNTLNGRVRQLEKEFMETYPHVLWVYDLDAPRPENMFAQSDLAASKSNLETGPQTESEGSDLLSHAKL